MVGENLFHLTAIFLAETNIHGNKTQGMVWGYEGELLCEDKSVIAGIAELFKSLGARTSTGYYDPAEDIEDDCVDIRTGHYFVRIRD